MINDENLLSTRKDSHRFIVGVGNPNTKETLVKIALKSGLKPAPTFIHPTSLVQDAKIGRGGVICPNTVITTNVKIGDYVTLNPGVTIGHDTTVGDFSNLSPGVNIAGNCIVGKKCDLGINSCIIPQVSVADSTVIGASACVIKTIVEPGVYVGVPAGRIQS